MNKSNSRRRFLKDAAIVSGVAGISSAVSGSVSRAWSEATGTGSVQKIVVSPDGPVKTLLEARDAARAQRRSGKAGPITITIRAGRYFLPETLILGPEDSDTIWEAPHGEHPIISGGRLISGWTKKEAGSAWTAHAAGPYFRQLFVNGRRAARARSPKYGFFRIVGESPRISPSSSGTAATISKKRGPKGTTWRLSPILRGAISGCPS